MESIFDKKVTDELATRVSKLTPETQPAWGKMSVAQMMAHCNVAYDEVYAPDKFKTATGLKLWFLRTFIKPMVVGEKPYRKNLRTAPEFLIVDERTFQTEHEKLLANIHRAHEDGREYFEGRLAPSFGPMTADEWSNLFHKHLDHHLRQFGV